MVEERQRPVGVGGPLLVLALLLMVGQPASFGLTAAAMLNRLPLRGLPFALTLLARGVVTAFGIAAGMALLRERPAAVTLVRISLVLSAAMDLFIYATPYYPNNRMPGDTKYYVAFSLAYCGGWLAYLFRSRRVNDTFGNQ